MENFRCQCKKIVFQVEGDCIIIKCRHCKRYIHVETRGIINVAYSLGPEETMGQKLLLDTRKA